MIGPAEQLDRRFEKLKPWLSLTPRPAQGWLKAIRQALGMTTGQMGKRLRVAQTRVSRIEAAEVDGSITLKTLERASEALGCKVIYVLVPNRPLTETLRERADELAKKQLASVEQTMLLEDQSVTDKTYRKDALDRLSAALLRRPSKLWDRL